MHAGWHPNGRHRRRLHRSPTDSCPRSSEPCGDSFTRSYSYIGAGRNPPTLSVGLCWQICHGSLRCQICTFFFLPYQCSWLSPRFLKKKTSGDIVIGSACLSVCLCLPVSVCVRPSYYLLQNCCAEIHQSCRCVHYMARICASRIFFLAQPSRALGWCRKITFQKMQLQAHF